MSTFHRAAHHVEQGPSTTVTGVRPTRSVFSTEAVDPQTPSVDDERTAALAVELLRCSELCRLAAGLLTSDGREAPTAITDQVAPEGASPAPGPRWSVRPVPRPAGHLAA